MNVVELAGQRSRRRFLRRLAAGALVLGAAIAAAKGAVPTDRLAELWTTMMPLAAAKSDKSARPANVKATASGDSDADGDGTLFGALEARAGLTRSGVTVTLNGAKRRYTHRDVLCLARGIYHDGAKLGEDGRTALALVALNRLESGDFGESMCRVVFRGMGSQFGCLYREACRAIAGVPNSAQAWENAIALAVKVFKRETTDPKLAKATHFYSAKRRPPSWAKSVESIAEVDGLIIATEQTAKLIQAKAAAAIAARNADASRRQPSPSRDRSSGDRRRAQAYD